MSGSQSTHDSWHFEVGASPLRLRRRVAGVALLFLGGGRRADFGCLGVRQIRLTRSRSPPPKQVLRIMDSTLWNGPRLIFGRLLILIGAVQRVRVKSPRKQGGRERKAEETFASGMTIPWGLGD